MSLSRLPALVTTLFLDLAHWLDCLSADRLPTIAPAASPTQPRPVRAQGSCRAHPDDRGDYKQGHDQADKTHRVFPLNGNRNCSGA
jgi:hypothetical protein